MKNINNILKTLSIISVLVIVPAFSINAQEPTLEPLQVTCDVSTESAYFGDSVTWTANVSGGDGSYTYNWNGDISGDSSSVTESFDSAGVIQASVMVADGLGTIESASCENMKVIAPLEFVSCSAVETNSNTGYEVKWKAVLSGGIAPYGLTWTGDDGLSDSDTLETGITYTTTGEKTAKVSNISSSDGQTIVGEWDCSPTVTVEAEPDAMSVSCAASSSNINTGDSVDWIATVSGGTSPYTFDWTGSEDLSGSNESVSKTYSDEGSKTASVTVTSEDGQVAIGVACGTVSVSEPQTTTGSSGGSSSGGRRRSSSNSGDDTATSTATTTDDGDTDTSTTTTTVVTTSGTIPTNVVTFSNTNTGEVDGVNTDESTSTATSTDNGTTTLETATSTGLLAALGSLSFGWLADYWWLVLLILIALGLIVWFIVAKKKKKAAAENANQNSQIFN